MNLILFNLAVDRKHATLAFCLKWIEKLSNQFDHIDVVTMYQGEYSLPKNVTVWSLGKEKNYPEWLRVIRFYIMVIRIYMYRRPHVAFCHMIPIFAILFWPVAKLTKTKIVMWYAHGACPTTLKVAHKLVNVVVSSTKEGFRLASSKLNIIGQGVDLELFPFSERSFGEPLSVVTVGRIAPSKNIDKVLKALNIWSEQTGHPYTLTIVGEGTTSSEKAYSEHIKLMAAEQEPRNHVVFTGRLLPEQIKDYLAKSQLFISMGATGSLDKAIVESMASGCIVMSANDAFSSIARSENFEQLILSYDEYSIADKIKFFYELSSEEKSTLSKLQSDYAIKNHGLNGLVKKLTHILRSNAIN